MSPLLDGKTIERVETSPPSPYDGSPDDSRLVLYLSDGSMVEITGGGDECDDWISAQELTPAEQAKRLLKAAEHKAKVEEQREERRVWLALTCEQRQAELAKRKPDILSSLIDPVYFDMIARQLEQGTTWDGTPERTVRDRCPKCRERECPNAPTRIIPAKPGLNGATSITFDYAPRRTRARRN